MKIMTTTQIEILVFLLKNSVGNPLRNFLPKGQFDRDSLRPLLQEGLIVMAKNSVALSLAGLEMAWQKSDAKTLRVEMNGIHFRITDSRTKHEPDDWFPLDQLEFQVNPLLSQYKIENYCPVKGQIILS